MENLKDYLHELSANISDPAECRKKLARKKADVHNKTKGTLEWFDCPKCLNRGNFARVRNGEDVYFVECDCRKLRETNRLIHESGLKELMGRYTFSTYQVHEKWQHILSENALSYARELTGAFMVCGQSGAGKTHLCTAICGEALKKRIPVRYMLWVTDSTKLKDPAYAAERGAKMDRLKEAPLLYIDDLFKPICGEDGSSFPSKADIRLAFELINHRYNRKLPTIISTELTPGELWNIDQATASRIREMAGTNIYTIGTDDARNIRTKL